MARPPKNTVDYFPFYCEEGKKMFYIEQIYGNDGFSVFVKLLRELARTEYHYLDLSKKNTVMFLSAKCRVSEEKLKDIIKALVDLDKFDKNLWAENEVIWCQDFIDSIQDAYNRRNNICMTYHSLCERLLSLGERKPSSGSLTDDINNQTILYYTILYKTILYKPLDLFNKICTNLTKIRTLTVTRKKHFGLRVKEHGEENVIKVLEMANNSKFLTGNSKTKFTAGFDWIFKTSNFIKILEGNYNKEELEHQSDVVLDKIKNYD